MSGAAARSGALDREYALPGADGGCTGDTSFNRPIATPWLFEIMPATTLSLNPAATNKRKQASMKRIITCMHAQVCACALERVPVCMSMEGADRVALLGDECAQAAGQVNGAC